MNLDDSTVTLTFCECAENHKGMQQLGKIAEEGFKIRELKEMQAKFEEAGAVCEYINLNKLLDEEQRSTAKKAAVLVIRGGVDIILGADGKADSFAEEMFGLKWDKKMLDRGKVKNKRARHNLVFDDQSQKAHYSVGKGTVVNYKDIPICRRLRRRLPQWFGDKAKKMKCEGNAYYDWKDCYCGLHGDKERKLVIAVRLGHSFPLWYQWYLWSKPVSKKKKINLYHGDMYVMSEKAVGNDWYTRKEYTLRHAAGTNKKLAKTQKNW